ncbi:MAG: hypothetical protein LBN38_06515 [Verrucomicrobiota bacterium]|jgi:hypothetical protein|nr:hypothetical protein [Verrucomicrobiota bacterium]
MKTLFRLFAFVLILSCFCQVSPAQMGEVSGGMPWTKFEEQLGLPTTYSVDIVAHAMGMSMQSRMIRDGDKSRAEMTLPFMDLKAVMLSVQEGDRIVNYSLFPEKMKYVVDETVEAADKEAMPDIQELGTEMLDGVECIKRGFSSMENGIPVQFVFWFSPEQKNMPVKMTASMQVPEAMMDASMGNGAMETSVLFQNYDFSTPDASLFELPEGYARASNIMEVMMDGNGAKDLDALFQQLQPTK